MLEQQKMGNRYQNSECRGGYLHKWTQLELIKNGSLERCDRCGLKMWFPADRGANRHYLSYHIRSVLRANDPRFIKEYPNATR